MFTPALAEKILEQIVDGRSVREICAEDDMPDRFTVHRWVRGDIKEAVEYDFAAKYAQAREDQGDAMADLVLETARATTPDTAQADRVKIEAYRWRAEKLKAKVYGTATRVDMRVSGRLDVAQMTDEQVNARLAALLAMAGAGGSDAPGAE